MLNQFPNSSCGSVFHKVIISLRAERRRREARRVKFTRENLTLPGPSVAKDDEDDGGHLEVGNGVVDTCVQ